MYGGDALMASKRVGNARFLEYIRTSCSDGAFNALVNSLPLQIGVWAVIVVLFTFSLSFIILAT